MRALLVCLQHEFPVKGHPSTPFAVATAVMMKRPDHGNGNGTSAREAVLLVAALADIGVTGALGLTLTGLVTCMQDNLGGSCTASCAPCYLPAGQAGILAVGACCKTRTCHCLPLKPAGTHKPGLVLQWSGAEVPASQRAQPQPVEDLPGGWKTLPDLSWDGGEAWEHAGYAGHLLQRAAEH
jgi:hypothetical protein